VITDPEKPERARSLANVIRGLRELRAIWVLQTSNTDQREKTPTICSIEVPLVS
jgi:hypothetical protein